MLNKFASWMGHAEACEQPAPVVNAFNSLKLKLRGFYYDSGSD